MSRYRFVSTMKAEGFPVDAACEAAEVSTSAYYEWLQRAAGPTVAELDEAYLIKCPAGGGKVRLLEALCDALADEGRMSGRASPFMNPAATFFHCGGLQLYPGTHGIPG